MKSEIFLYAITKRNKIKFIYELNEFYVDPYYIAKEKSGKKVLYGKVFNSTEIKKFDFNRIANIKILNNKKFSPVIPLAAYIN